MIAKFLAELADLMDKYNAKIGADGDFEEFITSHVSIIVDDMVVDLENLVDAESLRKTINKNSQPAE